MPTDLHFGLILALTIRGLAVTSYEEMRTVAARAEALGFDSVWLCDHFLTLDPGSYVEDAGIARGGAAAARRPERRSMPLLECWTALSALARDTRRLRLGTSVLCHSYRSPAVLANNFRIEDRMHHRVDTDLALTNGLVTWVAGNLYVTTPGGGSTDSSIQRGIDAASATNTVNVENGTYNEDVVVTKTLTLLGDQRNVDPRLGRAGPESVIAGLGINAPVTIASGVTACR